MKPARRTGAAPVRRRVASVLAGTVLAALAALGTCSPAAAATPPDTTRWFYHGRDYGSDALVNPLQLVVNGAFGILQLENRDPRLDHIDYANGARNVWMNLRDPFTSIRASGWRNFVGQELLPFSTTVRDARYWPNYTQHLIGGGMSWRMMKEWYTAHDYAHPTAWSLVTLGGYHFLNEVVENDGYVGRTTDPIADLEVFDPLGILLFSHPSVCAFFSRRLNMADWSYQPCIDPTTHALANNGQNFALKLPIGHTRWSLFDDYGVHSEGGLSYALGPGRGSISFGGGFSASDLVDLGNGERTVDLVPSGGLFYDRDNSLLASLSWSRHGREPVRVNLYPGWLKIAGWSPGMFVAENQRGKLAMGLNVAGQIPVGFAFQP